jgi:hypothetical protein
MVKESMLKAKEKRLEEESKLNGTGVMETTQQKGKSAGIAHLKENPAEN